MADRTHNEIENSRNGRHSNRIVYNYNLQDCQERNRSDFEDFTVTLTKDLVNKLEADPSYSKQIDIIFRYTSEGTLWLVNGEYWAGTIHKFAKKYDIPLQNITFLSGSGTVQSSYDKWHEIYAPNEDKFKCDYEHFGFYLYGKNKRYYDHLQFTTEPPTELRKHKFNCFNRNMLAHRQRFMLSMWEKGLIETDKLTSFHYYNNVDTMEQFPVPEELQKLLPIQCDIKGDWQTAFDTLFEVIEWTGDDGGDWNKVGDYRYVYENCYFTVTTESSECFTLADQFHEEHINDYFRPFHTEMFITEKTTRPMLNLHPQLIYCCTGTLDHLKGMGYKTFGNYWNEDYDNETDPIKKVDMLTDVIKELNNKPIEELHEMYWDMMPILKHNQSLLINQ